MKRALTQLLIGCVLGASTAAGAGDTTLHQNPFIGTTDIINSGSGDRVGSIRLNPFTGRYDVLDDEFEWTGTTIRPDPFIDDQWLIEHPLELDPHDP